MKNNKKNVFDTVDSENNQFNIKTALINHTEKLSVLAKIPLKLLIGIVASGLIGGFIVSSYSNNILDENRQKIAYVADLRQLSERIEKSALQARTGSNESFNELRSSEEAINKILVVLKNGGQLNNNKEIPAMDQNLAPKFDVVLNEWNQNKPLLDSLINQERNIITLKKNVTASKDKIQILLDSTSNFQKLVQYQDPKNSYLAQELFLLSNRINQGNNDLFSGDSFSLENGYALVKDLRQFNKLINIFKNGSSLYNVQPMTDPNLLTYLTAVQRAFEPFSNFSEEVVSQVQILNTAKEVALQVANSSRDIVNTAGNLNSEYTNINQKWSNSYYIVIAFFILSVGTLILITIQFFEKEKKAEEAVGLLEKNQNNQAAVNLLLEQLKPMDSGDFSRRVYVPDRFVTQIAEKVDNTREGFAKIVRKIKSSSQSILDNAENTDATSRSLLNVSDLQYAQMETSIQKLRVITSEMDEVAQTTWIAQEESNQSKEASQEGKNLVSKSILKMDEIRENIQESSKKIKKSSESAQAISEVTALIQNITKQIEVLALNAAIQAASSGEAGREFAIVAQEVQRLAFDSKEATQQIFDLVKEVQEDIGVAVSSMEITTQEVIEGARLTDNAGQALKKIEQLSQQVVKRVSEASERLEEKSSDMTKISLDMQELQTTTEKSKEIVNITVNQVEALKAISQELTNTVQRYRVDK